MNVNRMKILYAGIYKTVNNFSPPFMGKIFNFKESKKLLRERYQLNLEIDVKPVHFYGDILKVLGAKMWNNLSYHIIPFHNLEILNRNY